MKRLGERETMVRLRARLIIGNELSGTKAFSPEGVRQKTHSFAFITHGMGQGDVQIHISEVHVPLVQCFVVYPSICVRDWVLFCLPMGVGEIQMREKSGHCYPTIEIETVTIRT